MIVYHGSCMIVDFPLCHIGRNSLDFGQGFYVTDNRDQAEQWALRQSTRLHQPPILNIYEFDKELVQRNYRYCTFDAYDMAWLDFIVKSRTGVEDWKNYDCIEGGVADDRVVDTVNLYRLGVIPASYALRELSKHQPNNQICILLQKILNDHLHYISNEVLSCPQK